MTRSNAPLSPHPVIDPAAGQTFMALYQGWLGSELLEQTDGFVPAWQQLWCLVDHGPGVGATRGYWFSWPDCSWICMQGIILKHLWEALDPPSSKASRITGEKKKEGGCGLGGRGQRHGSPDLQEKDCSARSSASAAQGDWAQPQPNPQQPHTEALQMQIPSERLSCLPRHPHFMLLLPVTPPGDLRDEKKAPQSAR